MATKQKQPNSAAKQAAIKIRRAKSSDAARIAELSGQLGYPATAAEIAQRLRTIKPASQHAVLVAESPERESHRLAARQRFSATRGATACRSEWLGSGRRRTKPRNGRSSAARCGTVGAQSRVQKHVRALQCNPRTSSSVLFTPWLRTLQNTKSFSQVNLSVLRSKPSTAPLCQLSKPQARG